jgi:hypothetical protein
LVSSHVLIDLLDCSVIRFGRMILAVSASLVLAILLMVYIGNFNLQISKSFRDSLRYELRLYQRGVRKQTLTVAIGSCA